MSPEKHKPLKKKRPPSAGAARSAPDSRDVHEVVYFRRHKDDDPTEAAPGRDARATWPTKVRATTASVLIAVAAAPPYRYSGGGYWEAMHGDLTGLFEVRVDGPDRHHYRLICVIDANAKGLSKPYLVVLAGLDKPFRSKFSVSDYQEVLALRDEYLSREDRSLDARD